MRRCVLLLGLILAASASPALAEFINLELTVSYFPPAEFPANSHFVGTASFYLEIPGGNGPQPTDSPALIFIDVFERTVSAFEDPSLVDPCIGNGSCGVDTSVRGTAGSFTVFAFPSHIDFPAVEPALSPIIPIGSLSQADPCRDGPGNPCRQTGWLVAYDSGPVVVGSWDVAMSAVPEPSGMALLGISILLVMQSARSRRRAVQPMRRSLGECPRAGW